MDFLVDSIGLPKRKELGLFLSVFSKTIWSQFVSLLQVIKTDLPQNNIMS